MNLLNLVSYTLKKMDLFLTEDKLNLVITSRNTLGRNITFVLSNPKLLENKELFYQIYMFLMTNKDFWDFGEHKVIIVNGIIKDDTFNLHHNILIKNNTTFYDYWNKIEDILENVYEEGYAIEGIPMVEINVWNMDHLANKKIKITRNALTGRDIYTVTDKEVMKDLKKNRIKKRYRK